MATYLDRILAAHRSRAAADSRSFDELLALARDLGPARGFRSAIVAADGLSVIAEIKRRSPSKGDLNPGLDVAEWASAYARGGATALSVLTDGPHFGGSPADLVGARAAVDVPVLRKDFTVVATDVVDARLMGADCVLLIVAALSPGELEEYFGLATELGLDALIETHDEGEVERAVAVGADLIGVNQRDLVTFEVDTDRAVRVGASIPAGVIRVAESGVRGVEDATVLRRAGYDAVLVGETLVSSPDPAAAVAGLRGVSG